MSKDDKNKNKGLTGVKNEEDLIENKEAREMLLDKIEILDTAKELVLLPDTQLATTRMVAEWFEVTSDVIRDNIRRNREELEENGLTKLSYKEIKELVNSEKFSQLKVSRQGAVIFSRRTILNMAMMLRDSVIAKRVRTALLDQQETMTTEQKVAGIDEERELLMKILMAEGQTEQAIAVSNLNIYHKRHKAELNKRINEMKPKEESYDTFISTDGYQSMNDVAKSIGYGRNKLYQFLRDSKVLMKSNTPYQRYVNQGWFVVKQGTVVKENFQKNYAQTYVTAKGVDGITKMLKKKGLI